MSNIRNLTVRINELSRALSVARVEGNVEDIEALEDELEELEEMLEEEEELSRSGHHDWN